MAHLKDFRSLEGTDFFAEDRGFQTVLADLLAEADREAVFSSLHAAARLVSGRWGELADLTARPEHHPKIVRFDRVGNVVERVEFSPLTTQMRREVVEFGLFSTTRNELHKFGLIYLLAHNGEVSLTCPISCTDGLIRVLEAKGSTFLRDTYLSKLRSTETPIAGAQFVTERTGGSDVGAVEMRADCDDAGNWVVTGDKWYCSNPDEYFAVVARPEGARGGTGGLGLFFVPRVLPDGRPNRLEYRRLKNKLGTQTLPTAEIVFDRAVAHPIGAVGDGFKTLMNHVLNTSRIHNAVNACGFLHRAFLEARNYARQRDAFGDAIVNYPLVRESLVRMLKRLWRTRLLTFRLISLVDKNGLVPENADQALWQRFLTNLAKYRTASYSTDVVKEAILVFGANGIVEDFSILPRLLRDAMILETWEGTHNTLCLQILRDCSRSTVLEQWHAEIASVIERWPEEFLPRTRDRVETIFQETTQLTTQRRTDRDFLDRHARRLVDRLGGLLELAWMAETALAHAETDSTVGLLTALSASVVFPEDWLTNEISDTVFTHAQALIDETPIHADLTHL